LARIGALSPHIKSAVEPLRVQSGSALTITKGFFIAHV
jgi:hypothetical protein